jgi:hypothetical protein
MLNKEIEIEIEIVDFKHTQLLRAQYAEIIKKSWILLFIIVGNYPNFNSWKIFFVKTL